MFSNRFVCTCNYSYVLWNIRPSFLCLAENVAKQWSIGREAQDQYAVHSQNRAEKAQKENVFQEEIVSVSVKSKKGNHESLLILI